MPSLRNRHSWPQLPKVHRIREDKPIDSDPFAHFVSPTEDSIIYIEGGLTAGISPRSRSRSLPPISSRKPRIEILISFTSPTARLKGWIERLEKQYFHRSYRYADEPDPIIKAIRPRRKPPAPSTEPIIIPISPPIRGRRDARTGSRQRRNGNNDRTPPRRPRVWREPSAGIWSVAEEDEDGMSGLGIAI
ncbi:MAG: hypothetical protein HETSPECPRED_009750 [Heterodermia speciosa]|uniref:Uncharacterized protein n=1 Tax=Heterodermia speciosa TaxID=116794 RepID=A0A8H3IVG7_9LECA|nr:MAG: hypothetical protein HETSPECPRED_009750 [Heterodermia speciosa]